MLDYLLYQVDKPFVLLSNEIDHINDYIALEKMRFNDTLNINFITRNTSEDIKIAPMLLIPFIENSFKHGTLNEGILNINIMLHCENNSVFFQIENTSKLQEYSPNGIGLENIKKRLDLLYKDHYELDITNAENLFSVNLKLDNF